MNQRPLTRRQALGAVGMIAAASAVDPSPAAEQAGGRSTTAPARLAPRAELVNTLEYEAQAKLALAPAAFARIAGGDRAPFDRITLRPRMLVPTTDMDLGITLFGDALFAPILVAPIDNQTVFHADGEAATATGAAAARTAMIVSSRTSVPIATLVARTSAPVWFQVFASDPAAAAQAAAAVKAGCTAICVTIGAVPDLSGTRARVTVARQDWDGVAALRRQVALPLIVKGIATPEAAAVALRHRADGVIVSNYGGLVGPGADPPILLLPAIVDAIGGRVPVLVDGSVRRGTDILKALAFGARAVLVGRPVMWGLSAYGSEGVQGVLEMLQTELARYMGMCGKSNPAMLDRTVLVVHAARRTVVARRG